MKERIPLEAFILDEAEVDAVKYMPVADLAAAYRRQDPTLVPVDMDSDVRPWFVPTTVSSGSIQNTVARCCSFPAVYSFYTPQCLMLNLWKFSDVTATPRDWTRRARVKGQVV